MDPGVEFLYPSALTLSRCAGGCYFTGYKCTMKRQRESLVSVYEMTKGATIAKNIVVYNHTDCVCDCITRSSDCDALVHVYDPDTCSCMCKEDGSSCDPTKQTWNPYKCQCECNNPVICDDAANLVWNETTCVCDCKKRVKDRCVRRNKVLNTSTCECDCPTPLPTCDAGESLLKENCSCV